MPTKSSLPDLGAINRQLAASNGRVQVFLESLVGGIDHLIEASVNRDWQEVNRLSRTLAYGAELHGFPKIAKQAKNVSEALASPKGEKEVFRQMLHLVGHCGRVKRADQVTMR